MYFKIFVCRNCFTLQTVNVTYFQRKIQLSRFFAYPDDSPSQLIPISGFILYKMHIEMSVINASA